MLKLENISLEKIKDYYSITLNTMNSALNPNFFWKRYMLQELVLSRRVLDAKITGAKVLEGFFSSKEKDVLYSFLEDLNHSESYLKQTQKIFLKRSHTLKSFANKLRKLSFEDKEESEKLVLEYSKHSTVEEQEISLKLVEFDGLYARINNCKKIIDNLTLINNKQDDANDIDLENRISLLNSLKTESAGLDYVNIKKYVADITTKIDELDAGVTEVVSSLNLNSALRKGVLTYIAAFFATSLSPHAEPSKNLSAYDYKPTKVVETKIEDTKKSDKLTYDASNAFKNKSGTGHELRGMATYYANFFEGKKTASGVPFSQSMFSCAVPIGSEYAPRNGKIMLMLVRSEKNGKEIIVPAYDVGNFGPGNTYEVKKFEKDMIPRVIDLSLIARDSLRGNLPEDNIKVSVYPLKRVSIKEASIYASSPHYSLIN
ncbi:MAG: hypothetical protein ACP5N2_04360 [Candidatus Nanoarchaeia archaeon]